MYQSDVQLWGQLSPFSKVVSLTQHLIVCVRMFTCRLINSYIARVFYLSDQLSQYEKPGRYQKFYAAITTKRTVLLSQLLSLQIPMSNILLCLLIA